MIEQVLGRRWPEFLSWAGERALWPTLVQDVEADLVLIAAKSSLPELCRAYRAGLQDLPQRFNAIYEIHAAAILAERSSTVALHVPRGGGSERNFDVRAHLGRQVINVDSKTRLDDWPDNGPIQETVVVAGKRVTIRGGVRGDEERLALRDRLREALAQLPLVGPNLVFLGQRQGIRPLFNVERTLYGNERIHPGGRTTREPNGIFGGSPDAEDFKGLSGILWMRAVPVDGGIRWLYKYFSNPLAAVPLSAENEAVLNLLNNVRLEDREGSA